MHFDSRAFEAAVATESIGRRVVYLASTPSTMMDARAEADAGAPHGTLVLAEEQTAGRGRRGRSFHSPPGENLYFTIVLRLAAHQVPTLPVAVPLSVVEGVRRLGLDALIKWPNDIWVRERKLSGMLIDAESSQDGVVAFPGIGINVNGDPTLNLEIASIATSIRNELGHPVVREQLLADICNELEQRLGQGAEELLSAYTRHSLILGRDVEISEPGHATFTAHAVRLDSTGSLVVRLESGEERIVQAADVSVRPA